MLSESVPAPVSDSPAPPAPQLPQVVLRPSRGWASLRLGELWEYRELLYFLAWRDIKVRYKQTVLGAAWAIIQPTFAMIIFSLFLGRLGKLPSDGTPYPLFAYAGLLPWIYFANALSQSATSLAGSANLIRKVYFPRLTIPVATVLGGLLDFALGVLVLVGMMIYYHVPLTLSVLWVPFFLVLTALTAAGVGLWLSALDVQFRDVRYVVPFLIQLWMFATPVVYPSSMLSPRWRSLYALNPMAGVVEGFRWATLGLSVWPWRIVGVSAAVSVTLLVSGAFYFRRLERRIADLI
jgi:lipopolysaccharide transport system permease protein